MVSLALLVAAVLAFVCACACVRADSFKNLDGHGVVVYSDTEALSDFLAGLELTTTCTEFEPCVLDVQKLPSHIASINVMMGMKGIGELDPLPLACWDVRDGDPAYPQDTTYSCAAHREQIEFKCPRCFPSFTFPANYCPHVNDYDAQSYCTDERSNVFREGQFTVFDAKMRFRLGGLRVERLVPGEGPDGSWLSQKKAMFHWQRAYKVTVFDSLLSAMAQHKVENLDMEIDGSGNGAYNTVSIDSQPRGLVRPSTVALDLSHLNPGEGSFALTLSVGLNGAKCDSTATEWGAPCEDGHVSLDHDIPRYLSPMDIPGEYDIGTQVEYPWFFIRPFPRAGLNGEPNPYLPLIFFDEPPAYRISCGACTLGKVFYQINSSVRKAVNRVTFNMFGQAMYRKFTDYFSDYNFEKFLRLPLKYRGPDGVVNELLGRLYDGVHSYVLPTASEASAADLALLREEELQVTTSYAGFERVTVDYGSKLFNSTVKYVSDKLRSKEDGDLVLNNVVRLLLPKGELKVNDPRRPFQGVDLGADANVTIETPLFNVDVKVVSYSVGGLDSFDDTFNLLGLAPVRLLIFVFAFLFADPRRSLPRPATPRHARHRERAGR